MNTKKKPTYKTFAAGITGAFVLFPAAQTNPQFEHWSVEDRIFGNFSRVGARLDKAVKQVAREQEQNSAA